MEHAGSMQARPTPGKASGHCGRHTGEGQPLAALEVEFSSFSLVMLLDDALLIYHLLTRNCNHG